jgi:hypothetical protein
MSGEEQALYLDQMEGTIFAAFVKCASGYERMLRRPSGSVLADGFKPFGSFREAQRLT